MRAVERASSNALCCSGVPLFEAMSAMGVLALVANGTCLAMLWNHRHEDVNMSSVWECSRNDIAANVAALLAAAGVWLFDSSWPDLLIGSLLAFFSFARLGGYFTRR